MARKRAWWMFDPAEEKARKREEKAAERWGVFVWEAENMYRTESALRIFKYEKVAQKHADKENARTGANLVVRKIR